MQTFGPPVRQDQILPLPDDGGCVVPVERMVEKTGVMFEEEILFAGDIDVNVGICRIEIVEPDPGKAPAARTATQLSRGFWKAGWAKKISTGCTAGRCSMLLAGALTIPSSPSDGRLSGERSAAALMVVSARGG